MRPCSSHSAQTVSWPVLRGAPRLLRMRVSRGSGGLRKVISGAPQNERRKPPTSVLVGDNLGATFLLHSQKMLCNPCETLSYTSGETDRAVRIAKGNTDSDPLSGVVLCTHSDKLFSSEYSFQAVAKVRGIRRASLQKWCRKKAMFSCKFPRRLAGQKCSKFGSPLENVAIFLARQDYTLPHLLPRSLKSQLTIDDNTVRYGGRYDGRPPGRRNPPGRITHTDRQEEATHIGPWPPSHPTQHSRKHHRGSPRHRTQESRRMDRIEQRPRKLPIPHTPPKTFPLTYTIVPPHSRRPRHSHSPNLHRRSLQLHPHPSHPLRHPPPPRLRRRHEENPPPTRSKLPRLCPHLLRLQRLRSRTNLRGSFDG